MHDHGILGNKLSAALGITGSGNLDWLWGGFLVNSPYHQCAHWGDPGVTRAMVKLNEMVEELHKKLLQPLVETVAHELDCEDTLQ